MKKHSTCLICSSDRLTPLRGYYERHQLVKCSSCGFVFMENIPTLDELNAHYSGYSYTHEDQLSPLTVKSYQALLDEFENYRQTNKILDVGCGRGWFLEEAKKRGWEVYGTEYSDAAISICTSKGLRMTKGALSADSFSPDEFDVITSFEVIEHINNPLVELQHIHRFLRKNGLFYCTTPNFNAYLRYRLKENYNVIEYPEHLSYYTRRTLKKVVGKHGFKTVKFLSTGISVSRMQASKNTNSTTQSTTPVISSDEKLRQQINDKWYLGYAKKMVNLLLTWFGLGIALKGYFVKR